MFKVHFLKARVSARARLPHRFGMLFVSRLDRFVSMLGPHWIDFFAFAGFGVHLQGPHSGWGAEVSPRRSFDRCWILF